MTQHQLAQLSTVNWRAVVEKAIMCSMISQLVRIVVAAVAMSQLSGCGAGSEGATTSSTGTATAPTPASFNLEVTCVQLPEGNSLLQGMVQASLINIYVTDVSGNRLETLYTSTSVSFAGNYPSFDSTENNWGDPAAHARRLNANSSQYLLTECSYLDGRGRGFNLSSWNRVSQVRDKAIVVSLHTDFARRYIESAMRNGMAFDAAEAKVTSALASRFGANVYPAPPPFSTFRHDSARSEAFGSLSGYGYQFFPLIQLANQYVSYRLDEFSRYAAEQNFAGCAARDLCMLADTSRSLSKTINPDFVSGSTGWAVQSALQSGRVGTSRFTLDGMVELELRPNDPPIAGPMRVEVSQKIPVDGTRLGDFTFHLKLDTVDAGTTWWIANALASGVAGAYLCFESRNAVLGCYVAAQHFDAIQIPIAVGLAFQIKSGPDLYYDPVGSRNVARFMGLSKLASSIPNVAGRTRDVDSVRIGVLTTDANASTLEKCPGCFAKIIADRVAVEEFR